MRQAYAWDISLSAPFLTADDRALIRAPWCPSRDGFLTSFVSPIRNLDVAAKVMVPDRGAPPPSRRTDRRTIARLPAFTAAANPACWAVLVGAEPATVAPRDPLPALRAGHRVARRRAAS